MTRKINTDRNDRSFNQMTINAVWLKAKVVPGYNSDDYRKDSCGAWIKKSAYGTTGEKGWEIDHIQPVSKGGTDNLGNLQPLHWQNNRGKGDNYPNWTCSLKAAA